MDSRYKGQIMQTLREIEAEDCKCGARGTRINVEHNMQQGAPANADELMRAAIFARFDQICARCGRSLTSEAERSRYVALPICDLCALQEVGLELMNNPLPFRMWHCCLEDVEPMEIMPDEPVTPPTPPADQPEEPKIWYCSGKNGADAAGYPMQSRFVVLKGSRISSIVSQASSRSVSDQRDDLRNAGVINSQWEFTRDYSFGSCSTAASIVLGRNANGWVTWRDGAGNQLDLLRR